MKRFRLFCLLISLGIIIWSVSIDISTYNVYFISDKNIVLYCLDGIIFNLPKILMPIVIGVTSYIYDIFFSNVKDECIEKNENRTH